jgi:hypothetical protein
MDEHERILLDNFKEYWDSAEDAFRKGSFNSATTLYFKTIVALCDLFVLRKDGFVPSSHTHRFRVLEEKHKSLYIIADRDFPFYQDSYTKKMDKEAAQLLKDDAETIRKMLGV